jgi:short subunit fatty acids transporter
MARTGRIFRWIVGVSGAAILLQAGPCNLTSAQFAEQFVLPQISSVFSDTIFFLLDSALVHLTT